MKSDKDDLEIFVSRSHEDIVTINDFIDKRAFPSIRHITPSARTACFHSIFFRVLSWVRSLRQLKSPGHFQAIASGTRALLEAVVDVLLIHHDETDNNVTKVYWWGRSAILKSNKAQIEFSLNRKRRDAQSVKNLLEFVETHEAEILEMRKKLWPDPKNPNKGKHPERWTGSGNLLTDVINADILYQHLVEKYLTTSLEELYETFYRQLNWNVHGSGLVTRNVYGHKAGLPVMCALYYQICSRLSVLFMSIILEEYKKDEKLSDVPQLISELDTILTEIAPWNTFPLKPKGDASP